MRRSPQECVGYSPARLAAAAAANRVNCTWVCIHAALHCISDAHASFVAQRSHLKGKEWEPGCKAYINAQFDLDGTDAVVAGLFGGDYLPLMSAKVGRRGTVWGFEPTDAADVSRALAEANCLRNVNVQQTCLSNDTAPVRMCMRNPRVKSSNDAFGDRTHMVRADEELKDDNGRNTGGAHCGAGNADTAGGLVMMRCIVLDELLPWRSQRVGMLLLDVEGAEERVLWGAAGLTRRWLPVVATEPRLDVRWPETFRSHFEPLGYRYRGHCDGLSFYTVAGEKS